jgi:hypothetical protein
MDRQNSQVFRIEAVVDQPEIVEAAQKQARANQKH